MKILVIDPDKAGLPFSMACQAAGHEVKLWLSLDKSGGKSPVGEGIVSRPDAWEPYMKWADLIIVTDNSKYTERLERYFEQGYPIVGANKRSAELELDREEGIKAMQACGIKTIPYQTFENYDKAIAYVKETGKAYACKPWGGTSDKALTYVADSAANLVFKLEKWKRAGLKGSFMLQEKKRGVEMGVSGWFGPGGWCSYFDENWEHKKLMNDDLGCNTGEQGTVMRYVRKSKLFQDVLEPMGDYLMALKYVGNVDVNCMVGEDGTPWPLEFTMRFGWPSFNLCMSLHEGDPANWLAGLLEGQDLLQCRPDVCVGVVMAHGDYPYGQWKTEEVTGFPISGLTAARRKNVYLTSAMMAQAPVMSAGEVVSQPTYCTAGDYVAVVCGHGGTVEEARDAAYSTAWKIDWPSNRGFRTDIGCRLAEGLPLLQAFGYAKGMRYD